MAGIKGGLKFMDRQYYLQRLGHKPEPIEKADLIKLFLNVHHEFLNNRYFDNFYGYSDRYNNWTSGKISDDFEIYTMRLLGVRIKRPTVDKNYIAYSEPELFTLIELLYDNVLLPFSEETYGWTEEERAEAGKAHYRKEVNNILERYSIGYEITPNEGYIRELVSSGLAELVDNHEVTGDEQNVDSRVRNAIHLYLGYGSDYDKKKTALFELGTAFEFIRKNVEKTIPKEESEIFTLLNSFGIRHNRLRDQKLQYDAEVYSPWMFYYFLASFDAYAKLKARQANAN
jgi:hypothetical protein